MKIDPKVKDILKILATGAVISTAILVPGIAFTAGFVIQEYDKVQETKLRKELNKYNPWRLRQVLKRLEKEKMIKVDGAFLSITRKGKTKLLHYDLMNMQLNEKPDGKWRIVVYDIAELNKRERKMFQSTLKTLKFLQLQKSVYITPFPCEDEVEFLRQQFRISTEVKIIVATGLENVEVYNQYFGI